QYRHLTECFARSYIARIDAVQMFGPTRGSRHRAVNKIRQQVEQCEFAAFWVTRFELVIMSHHNASVLVRLAEPSFVANHNLSRHCVGDRLCPFENGTVGKEKCTVGLRRPEKNSEILARTHAI